MRLNEIFRQSTTPLPPIERYLNPNRPSGMPPLDISRLSIQKLRVGDKARVEPVVKMPLDGDQSLLLRYKEIETGALSVTELEGGEVLDITQVQGSRSRKSYRVASCLQWRLLLSDAMLQIASDTASPVRHLTMPDPVKIKNIEGGFEQDRNPIAAYEEVISRLKMRFSNMYKRFIVDVPRIRH